jgi:hypothetical protein
MVGFGRANPYFLTVQFQEGLCCHHGTCLSSSLMKSEMENAMTTELLGLVMIDTVFEAMKSLLGDL